jgi:hypothetical protein
MADYAIVCDGQAERHPQAMITSLRDGVIVPRGRRAIEGPNGSMDVHCGACKQSMRLRPETALAIGTFMDSHPELTVARVVPERFRDKSRSTWAPAVRLETLRNIARRLPTIRRNAQ